MWQEVLEEAFGWEVSMRKNCLSWDLNDRKKPAIQEYSKQKKQVVQRCKLESGFPTQRCYMAAKRLWGQGQQLMFPIVPCSNWPAQPLAILLAKQSVSIFTYFNAMSSSELCYFKIHYNSWLEVVISVKPQTSGIQSVAPKMVSFT